MGLQTEKDKEKDDPKRNFKLCSKKFETDELEVLKKIYKELGSRSSSSHIDKETFLQFFPLPGLWGERLFLKFNFKNTGYIDFEEFIIGIAICCRGTKSDKINVLFDIFDLNADGYIQKSEMVAMLSNIPYIHKLKNVFFNKKNRRRYTYDDESNLNGGNNNSCNIPYNGNYNNYSYCDNCMDEEDDEDEGDESDAESEQYEGDADGDVDVDVDAGVDADVDVDSDEAEDDDGEVDGERCDYEQNGNCQNQREGRNNHNKLLSMRELARKIRKEKKHQLEKRIKGIRKERVIDAEDESDPFISCRKRRGEKEKITKGCSLFKSESEEDNSNFSSSSTSNAFMHEENGNLHVGKRKGVKNRDKKRGSNCVTNYKTGNAVFMSTTSDSFTSNESNSHLDSEENDSFSSNKEQRDGCSSHTTDSFISIYGYLIKNKKKKKRGEKQKGREKYNEQEEDAEKGTPLIREALAETQHVAQIAAHHGEQKRVKCGMQYGAQHVAQHVAPNVVQNGIPNGGEENLLNEKEEKDHEGDKKKTKNRTCCNRNDMNIYKKEKKKEKKRKLFLNEYCLPSKTARNILNDEENKECSDKNVDVEEIVDMMLEECEFLDTDKITSIQFKSVIYKYDFFLYVFFSCLHEDIWGLQGNVLYGRDYISNFVIKSENYKNKEMDENEEVITEELYFKIRQLFIVQAPDYDCVNDNLCVNFLKEKNIDGNEKKEISEEASPPNKEDRDTSELETSKNRGKGDNGVKLVYFSPLGGAERGEAETGEAEDDPPGDGMKNADEDFDVAEKRRKFEIGKDDKGDRDGKGEQTGHLTCKLGDCVGREDHEKREMSIVHGENPLRGDQGLVAELGDSAKKEELNYSQIYDMTNLINVCNGYDKHQFDVDEGEASLSKENRMNEKLSSLMSVNGNKQGIGSNGVDHHRDLQISGTPDTPVNGCFSPVSGLNSTEERKKELFLEDIRSKAGYECDFNLLTNSLNDIFSKEIVEFIQASKISFNINDVCKERNTHNKEKYKKAKRNIEKVKNYSNNSLSMKKKKKYPISSYAAGDMDKHPGKNTVKSEEVKVDKSESCIGTGERGIENENENEKRDMGKKVRKVVETMEGMVPGMSTQRRGPLEGIEIPGNKDDYNLVIDQGQPNGVEEPSIGMTTPIGDYPDDVKEVNEAKGTKEKKIENGKEGRESERESEREIERESERDSERESEKESEGENDKEICHYGGKKKRKKKYDGAKKHVKDINLYSCPNCKGPFLMCPNCHSRYPRFCVKEDKIAMECEYCDCEHCYFYSCIYCNFDFQKCLDMIKKNSLKEGILYKIGKHLHQFKARYYILFDNLLYYYDKQNNLKPRGFMFLEGCYVEVISKNDNVSKYGFSICHKGTKQVQKRNLYVNTYEEREEWLHALYSTTKQNTLCNLYELHEQLGQGKFSSVYRGINKQTNSEFAIKVIDKRSVSIYEKELLRSEISILRLLRHPNVIFLKEIINTKETLYISMELVRGGELYDFLLTETRLSEIHANKIVTQLIKTVAYLHRCGIIHRDIKPENILLTDKSKDAQIKLTDFGLSTLCAPNELLKEPCGTLAYVAPEVITLQGYNHKVDAWSIGIILYLLLSGKLPFPINKNTEMNIQKNYILHFRDNIWKTISSSAKDLISKLLELNVDKRMSANEALEHIWIKNPTAVINENSVIYKNEEINILNLQDVSVSTFNIPKYAPFHIEDEKNNQEIDSKTIFSFHKENMICEHNGSNDDPVIPLPYSGAPLKENTIEKNISSPQPQKEIPFSEADITCTENLKHEEREEETSINHGVKNPNSLIIESDKDVIHPDDAHDKVHGSPSRVL
ncbi:calcium-dependent protein kinase 7, putative (CDPK7) [Plasmodium ovale curtisi]|uniref:Calcium-dependent protein kinase 7, putative (CDPK7) n=1 Tax=Plasmodium ovale curtisi TaxID=864141 RepID=A0A1A8VSW9_PLAOA|nr:calcium-dependent protein kinase 7, putative (CDPK7) [Plasmodium ovale curtisi]